MKRRKKTMDPMKQNDIQQVHMEDPVTGEVVTAIDADGKPVAGRYSMEPVREEMNLEGEVTMVRDSLENGVEAVEIRDGRYPEEADIMLDIDTSDGGVIHLTPPQERKAEILAVDEAVKWIKAHPGYTMDELRKEKARFLEKARIQVSRE